MSRVRRSGVEIPPRSRRRRLALAAGGFLALAVVATLGAGTTFRPAKGASTPGFLAALVHDPLSVLARRSPGARGAGPLFQVKPPAAALKVTPPGPKPESDVPAPLAGGPEFPLPTFPNLGGETPPAPGPESLLTPPNLDAPVFGLVEYPPPAPTGETVGGSPMIGAAPPGGGGGNLPSVLESPIPEPATWAMMIVGLFGVGLARRKRAKVMRLSPAADLAPSHVPVD